MSFKPSTVRGPSTSRTRETTSRIERWIEEQNKMPPEFYEHDLDGPLPMVGTSSQPYLAYPHKSMPSLIISGERPMSSSSGYTDQEPTPTQSTPRPPSAKIFGSAKAAPATPPRPSPGARREGAPPSTPSRGASPFRNIHLSFGSRRHVDSTPDVLTDAPALSTRDASHHGRSSSLSGLFSLDIPTELPKTPSKSPSTWKFKRVSVMNTFAAPADSPRSADSYQPRRSTSSSTTPSSSIHTTATRTSLDTPPLSSSLKKWDFSNVSVRSQAPSIFLNSAPSLWSLPMQASHLHDPPDSEQVITDMSTRKNSAAPRLSTSARPSKKRKLIISGIPFGDEARFEAAKKWCESFGELHQIVRAPSGDLHIDFKRSEVADTVCRLQARVYITGVGSVGLSWFTGKKP